MERVIEKAFFCHNCGRALKRISSYEKYCEVCGIVEEDYLDYDNKNALHHKQHGLALQPHELNKPQTKPSYKWKGKKRVLLI